MASSTTPIRKDAAGIGSMKDVEMAPLVNQEPPPPETPTSAAAAQDAAEKAALAKVLSACGMYSFCSVSMVLTNKSLASR